MKSKTQNLFRIYLDQILLFDIQKSNFLNKEHNEFLNEESLNKKSKPNNNNFNSAELNLVAM